MRLDCGCRKGLSFDDVFMKPKRSNVPSREVSLEREFVFLHSNRLWKGVPIIASNMDHTGTIPMYKALSEFKCMTALHKFHQTNDLKQLASERDLRSAWITIGQGRPGNNVMADLHTLVGIIRTVYGDFHPNINIDVANGYNQSFVRFVEYVRKNYPKSTIMAGNVASYEMVEQLIISGADIVKIGIGPGSACTTRMVTGVGMPQLSAIDECADAAHGLGGLICADGGCENSGHIAKAFGAGADFVMLGGMLAGHNECTGDFVLDDGSLVESSHPSIETFLENIKTYGPLNITGMTFRGMSSKEAQDEHYDPNRPHRTPEGKSVVVPYRGDVKETVQDILGGVASAMTYIGAKRLKDIPKCATMVPTNKQLNESFK